MDFSKASPSPATAPPAYGGNVPPATGIPVGLQPPPNYHHHHHHHHQFRDNNSFQPPPHHVRAADFPGRWSSGLCDCFSDIPNCCITLWCPCITFGQVAEIVDRGSTSCGVSGVLYGAILLVTGCGCLYSCFYRTKLRNQYMLPKSPCGDFVVHSCCEVCALCQEYRELKHRGFHMSLGWQGNVEKRTEGVMVAPFVQGGMTR